MTKTNTTPTMTSKDTERRPLDDPYNSEEWRSEPYRYWGAGAADGVSDDG